MTLTWNVKMTLEVTLDTNKRERERRGTGRGRRRMTSSVDETAKMTCKEKEDRYLRRRKGSREEIWRLKTRIEERGSKVNRRCEVSVSVVVRVEVREEKGDHGQS